MTPPKLQIWYGLPGSGKSTTLDSSRAAGIRVFDDFMRESIRHHPDFPYSRHFVDIVTILRAAEACAIADIRLCEHSFRRDVSEILGELVPRLSLEWHCFDCRTPEAVAICRDNVRFRAETSTRHAEHALQSIDRFAPGYSVADGAHIYPVVHARPLRPARGRFPGSDLLPSRLL